MIIYRIPRLASQCQDFTQPVFLKTCMILSLELFNSRSIKPEERAFKLSDNFYCCEYKCFDFEKVLNNGGQNLTTALFQDYERIVD